MILLIFLEYFFSLLLFYYVLSKITIKFIVICYLNMTNITNINSDLVISSDHHI